jgi:hypothetical protein
MFMERSLDVARQLQRQQSTLMPGDVEFAAVTTRMKEVNELRARVRCLGWSEAEELLLSLKRLPVDLELREAWCRLIRTSSVGLSPCFECFLSMLGTRAFGEKFRCILFVETRGAAHDMRKALKNASQHRAALHWLSPTCLVGHCKQGAGDDTMTIAKQKQILGDFRRGVYNVMVATSVAEEGIDIPCCNLVVRMEPVTTFIKFIQGRGRARTVSSRYIILCTDDSESLLVQKVADNEATMDRGLARIDRAQVAVNCWTQLYEKLPDPMLLAAVLQLPDGNRSDVECAEDCEQIVERELIVDVSCLMPTQATVQKTFSDGRSVMDAMVHLVRHPATVDQLPLMRVSKGSKQLLGRRGHSFAHSGQAPTVLWYAADNRRCFMFKVIAPLCGLDHVRVKVTNWTSEFEYKLMQTPRRGDTWATDAETIDRVRNDIINLLLEVAPPKRPQYTAANHDFVFDPRKDYVSLLKNALDAAYRPQQGVVLAFYRETCSTFPNFTMQVCIHGTDEFEERYTGCAHRVKKLAKQSAAFEALRATHRTKRFATLAFLF